MEILLTDLSMGCLTRNENTSVVVLLLREVDEEGSGFDSHNHRGMNRRGGIHQQNRPGRHTDLGRCLKDRLRHLRAIDEVVRFQLSKNSVEGSPMLWCVIHEPVDGQER